MFEAGETQTVGAQDFAARGGAAFGNGKLTGKLPQVVSAIGRGRLVIKGGVPRLGGQHLKRAVVIDILPRAPGHHVPALAITIVRAFPLTEAGLHDGNGVGQAAVGFGEQTL